MAKHIQLYNAKLGRYVCKAVSFHVTALRVIVYRALHIFNITYKHNTLQNKFKSPVNLFYLQHPCIYIHTHTRTYTYTRKHTHTHPQERILRFSRFFPPCSFLFCLCALVLNFRMFRSIILFLQKCSACLFHFHDSCAIISGNWYGRWLRLFAYKYSFAYTYSEREIRISGYFQW